MSQTLSLRWRTSLFQVVVVLFPLPMCGTIIRFCAHLHPNIIHSTLSTPVRISMQEQVTQALYGLFSEWDADCSLLYFFSSSLCRHWHAWKWFIIPYSNKISEVDLPYSISLPIKVLFVFFFSTWCICLTLFLYSFARGNCLFWRLGYFISLCLSSHFQLFYFVVVFFYIICILGTNLHSVWIWEKLIYKNAQLAWIS